MTFSSTNQPAMRERRIPWETVEAIRREWAAALDAIGADAEDRAGNYGDLVPWLRAYGQPTPADFRRKYGFSKRQISEVLHGHAYQYPPEEQRAVAKGRRSEAMRRWWRKVGNADAVR